LYLKLIFWRVGQWLNWFRKAKTIYRVHSPQLYGLVQAIEPGGAQFYAFDDVDFIRQKLLKSTQVIDYHDFGAGPGGVVTQEISRKRVSDLAQKSASDAAQGELLFKMVNHLKPTTILELGASLGVGSAYLTTPNRMARYVGIEGNPESAQIAQQHLDLLGCKNAVVLAGAFEMYIPKALKKLETVDFVYLDGDHREEPTLAYFEMILPYLSEKSVVVLDDIYWSAGMLRAYERLCTHERVRASLDLWGVGILFLDPAFQEPVHHKIAPKHWKPWEKYLSE
jgi:predicted O-methyltransferase YrrM